MSAKPTIIHGVQLFVLAKGKLAQGRFIQCTGVPEACRVAEERVRSGWAAGAVAFKRESHDTEFDDSSEPVALASFGRVPPEVVCQLPF